jgi:hypothetical protein
MGATFACDPKAGLSDALGCRCFVASKCYSVSGRHCNVGTMKEFDLQHWWNLVAAAGAITAAIFFVAQLNHGFLLGLDDHHGRACVAEMPRAICLKFLRLAYRTADR